ncbi:hypothetical protein LTR37_013935 [Vermiconidia calcicola]|uniref:Uncharacterized protein n=1 Tax=Vermiconidia calcicola TaxID=1690605 RepID=A0ACC3MXQ6_9PEZI|nr:hypothetical protein LTR37_013935 [Vermiconidia calcicola]
MVARDKLADQVAEDSDMDAPPLELTSGRKVRRPRSLQRMETALHSFRVLRGLTKKQVDNFLNSYVIYDLDWVDEGQIIEVLGPDYQKQIGECLSDYYSVLNHLCAIGELEKMYIPPVMDLHANIPTNQSLYEESITGELQLPMKAKVLDLGCGRGRVAAHISMLTGASVTGLNIDSDQVASAAAFNKEQRLPNGFFRADFNDLPLPFPDQYFDGFYQIQAFSLCKDIGKMCRKLYRVLKPGARVSLLDWAQLDAYNDQDPHHRVLMRRIKPLIGAIGTPTPESLAVDLENAGFKVLRMNNASINGLQSPLIERADGYFRMARMAVLGLVKLGLLPTHFKTLFNRLTQDCDAFVQADRARLITTSYHWLAEKPRKIPSDKNVATAPTAQESASESTPDPPASLNAVANEELSASSRRTSVSEVGSSEPNTKPPSSAISESTGITEPPPLPQEAAKAEYLPIASQL